MKFGRPVVPGSLNYKTSFVNPTLIGQAILRQDELEFLGLTPQYNN